MCRAYVLRRRAAVDPKAAVRRSVPKALSILASTDIAAVWVQAIERRARNEVADVLDKLVALTTAKTLGISFPTSLLLTADEVIE